VEQNRASILSSHSDANLEDWVLFVESVRNRKRLVLVYQVSL